MLILVADEITHRMAFTAASLSAILSLSTARPAIIVVIHSFIISMCLMPGHLNDNTISSAAPRSSSQQHGLNATCATLTNSSPSLNILPLRCDCPKKEVNTWYRAERFSVWTMFFTFIFVIFFPIHHNHLFHSLFWEKVIWKAFCMCIHVISFCFLSSSSLYDVHGYQWIYGIVWSECSAVLSYNVLGGECVPCFYAIFPNITLMLGKKYSEIIHWYSLHIYGG